MPSSITISETLMHYTPSFHGTDCFLFNSRKPTATVLNRSISSKVTKNHNSQHKGKRHNSKKIEESPCHWNSTSEDLWKSDEKDKVETRSVFSAGNQPIEVLSSVVFFSSRSLDEVVWNLCAWSWYQLPSKDVTEITDWNEDDTWKTTRILGSNRLFTCHVGCKLPPSMIEWMQSRCGREWAVRWREVVSDLVLFYVIAAEI